MKKSVLALCIGLALVGNAEARPLRPFQPPHPILRGIGRGLVVAARVVSAPFRLAARGIVAVARRPIFRPVVVVYRHRVLLPERRVLFLPERYQ